MRTVTCRRWEFKWRPHNRWYNYIMLGILSIPQHIYIYIKYSAKVLKHSITINSVY